MAKKLQITTLDYRINGGRGEGNKLAESPKGFINLYFSYFEFNN